MITTEELKDLAERCELIRKNKNYSIEQRVLALELSISLDKMRIWLLKNELFENNSNAALKEKEKTNE